MPPPHHSPRGPQARGQRKRAAVLSVAAALASEEGLEPLSIGRIADELGISKAGVFSLFGSKEALQLATIEAAREIYVDEVYRPALSEARGLPRLWGLCQSVISYLERRVFPGGCFFVAIQTEFDARSGPVRERLVEIQGMWSETWLRLVEEAQAAGDLNPDVNPGQLAFELGALTFAAGGLVRMPGTEELLVRTRAALRARLVDAGADPEWFCPPPSRGWSVQGGGELPANGRVAAALCRTVTSAPPDLPTSSRVRRPWSHTDATVPRRVLRPKESDRVTAHEHHAGRSAAVDDVDEGETKVGRPRRPRHAEPGAGGSIDATSRRRRAGPGHAAPPLRGAELGQAPLDARAEGLEGALLHAVAIAVEPLGDRSQAVSQRDLPRGSVTGVRGIARVRAGVHAEDGPGGGLGREARSSSRVDRLRHHCSRRRRLLRGSRRFVASVI